jgi:hypothetical protein
MTKKDNNKGSLSEQSNKPFGTEERNCKPVSYKDTPFTQKPDCAGNEKRIDAHSLFSMFTANVIKEKIKWFR